MIGEKLISSDQFREELWEIWPKLQFIVMTDPIWLDITPELLAENLPEPIKIYIPNAFECEEHSIGLVFRQRLAWAKKILAENLPEAYRYNFPIGFEFGTKYDGTPRDHYWCIARTSRGIRLIEPQTNRIWVPDPQRDNVDILMA